MKKVVIIIVCTILFTMNSRSQNLFKYEYNQVTNNTYSLDLNLLEDSSFKLNHYIVFWDMGKPKDTLGLLYKYIELGCSANFELIKNALNARLNIGFGNGNYHSGGGDFRIFENLNFGLDINYHFTQKIYLDLKGYGSVHIAKGNGKRPLIDRYLWNYNINYKIGKKADIGLMFEQYILTETYPKIKLSYSKYLWFGPTATFNLLSNQLKIQSSLGADFIDYIDSGIKEDQKEVKQFYKLLIEYSF